MIKDTLIKLAGPVTKGYIAGYAGHEIYTKIMDYGNKPLETVAKDKAKAISEFK